MGEGGLRFGIGFDSHPRDEARDCWIGGVLFADEPGLAGHSDADVVSHSLADAVLGAAALGDLGQHFPGIDLLKRARSLIRAEGLDVRSCDCILIAERPSVAPRRGEIRQRLANALGIAQEHVSVKGTRPEGLGLSGDGAACLALAVLAPR